MITMQFRCMSNISTGISKNRYNLSDKQSLKLHMGYTLSFYTYFAKCKVSSQVTVFIRRDSSGKAELVIV